jgi:hypothetical protein
MLRQIPHYASRIWDYAIQQSALVLSITHMLVCSLLLIFWFGHYPPSQALFWSIYTVLVLCVLPPFFILGRQFYPSQKRKPSRQRGICFKCSNMLTWVYLMVESRMVLSNKIRPLSLFVQLRRQYHSFSQMDREQMQHYIDRVDYHPRHATRVLFYLET